MTLELADRPAYHLSRLMVKKNLTPYTLSARAWAAEIASGELSSEAARSRVKNILTKHWPRPDHIPALATALDVDPGYFYRTPAQVGEG